MTNFSSIRKLALCATASLALLCATASAAPTVWESSFGTNVGLSDDSVASRNLGFNFNFLGTSYSSIEISSNGFLSLGGTNGNGCCAGVVPGLLNGVPRIALAWYDHRPSGTTSGSTNNIFYNTFANRAVITWNQVPAFDSANIVFTGQIQLFSDGRIVFGFDDFSNDGSSLNDQVLIGLSGGGGATDPGESNLFAGAFNTGAQNSVYQLLNDGGNPQAYNFNDTNVCFTPNLRAGWSVNACGADVPEPTTLALAGLAVAGLGLARRRRSAARA